MVSALAVLPSEAHPKLWATILALCVIGNVLWYAAKFILRSHGYAVSFVWHFSDILNLFRLVSSERDSPQRLWHVALLVSLCVVILAFIASAATFFMLASHP